MKRKVKIPHQNRFNRVSKTRVAIIEDLFDAVGMTINRAVVKSHITHSAESITQIIQDEMKGIFFCLNLDIEYCG